MTGPTLVRNNLIGIILMIAAMAAFAVEDGLIKYLSGTVATGQILILIGLGGTAVFATWALLAGHRYTRAHVFHPALIIRTLAELVGTCGFVASLALADISVISAIVQINPLLVTLGAALFLGETVGPRRWVAIFVGMIGMLIILRPGAADFNPAYVLTVIGVIGLSVRDVATRRVPKDVSTLVMASLGFGAVVPAGIILMAFGQSWTGVSGFEGSLFVVAIIIGVAAYLCIITATRIGEVSAVTPFRYSRLIFGAMVGLIAFGETLDTWTLAGAAIIVASGLYAFWRESQAR